MSVAAVCFVATACGGEAAGPSVTVVQTNEILPTSAPETSTTTEASSTTVPPTELPFADDDEAPEASATTPEPSTTIQTTTTTVPSTTTPTTDPPTTSGESTTSAEGAPSTTIDPSAPFEGLQLLGIPHADAESSMSLESVNLQCNSGGVTPQIVLTSPSELAGVDQRVSFYGPSGANYVTSGSVDSGQLERLDDWLTTPVGSTSFDASAICDAEFWRVLVEISDNAGGFFSGAVDATISG